MAEVIVTKWEEFKEAVSVAENTVICPPEVWDLTDETISNLQINCKEIQGNGLTLKGLYLTDRINVFSTILADLNFLGVYAPFSQAFHFGHETLDANVIRCGFSGTSNYEFINFPIGVNRNLFEKCSFRVKAKTLVLQSGNLSFDFCDMLLDCTEDICFNARNSRISGKLRGGLSMNQTAHYSGNYGLSVIDAEIPAEATLDIDFMLENKKILINKDLCAAPIPSELIPVTSAQLNDTGYLTSIGFLTGG